MEGRDKFFHEAGLQIKERKASGQKMSPGKSEKGCRAVQQTAELATATRMEKGIKTELLDCLQRLGEKLE